MNIFEHHLSEIKKIILSEKDFLGLEVIDNLQGINLEIPPEQFNFDLSCNIAMVLGKKNKINPKTLALKLKDIFISKINSFSARIFGFILFDLPRTMAILHDKSKLNLSGGISKLTLFKLSVFFNSKIALFFKTRF